MHKSRSNVLLQAHWKGLVCGGRPAWLAPGTRAKDSAVAGHVITAETAKRCKPRVSPELSNIAAFHFQLPILSNIWKVPADIYKLPA